MKQKGHYFATVCPRPSSALSPSLGLLPCRTDNHLLSAKDAGTGLKRPDGSVWRSPGVHAFVVASAPVVSAVSVSV